jgi:hypothetical protein
MDDHKFIFVCWPDGSWTIALNREYCSREIEDF